MKLLTVTVPCYNSEDYMEKCIQSLLPLSLIHISEPTRRS